MKLSPRGLAFNHVTQNSNTSHTPHTDHAHSLYTPTHLTQSLFKPFHDSHPKFKHFPHTSCHATLSNPHQSLQHSHSPTSVLTISHSLNPNTVKPTPILTFTLTLTQTLRRATLSLKSILTTDHSHSNPHWSSQSLTLQTQI